MIQLATNEIKFRIELTTTTFNANNGYGTQNTTECSLPVRKCLMQVHRKILNLATVVPASIYSSIQYGSHTLEQ